MSELAGPCGGVGLYRAQNEKRIDVFRDVEAEQAGEPQDGVDKGRREEELGVVQEGERCGDGID